MTTTKRRWHPLPVTVVAALACAAPWCTAPAVLAETADFPSPAKHGADLSMTATTARNGLRAQWPVPPGGTVTYTLKAKNIGPSVAKNAKVTDTLPTGMTFISSKDGCTAAGQKVTCGPVSQLAVGASRTWTLQARIAPSYTGNGKDLKNTATITSDTDDPQTTNNTASAALPGGGTIGKATADLTTKLVAVGTNKVAPGEQFAYTVTTQNAGPSDATKAVAADTLPTPLTFVSSKDGCTANGRTVTCTTAAINSGAAKSWTFTVKLDPAYTGDGKDLKNTASSSSGTQDPNPGNNQSTPADPPGGGVTRPKADLEVTKTSS
ncbi:DUF11 domain-containing protein [Streptomyces sp. WM6378]|uniref:DUF11 domain-containing protein n=1 Tax=Streptomyces sp. WM6378 TaxID=1415557 RepID=UPI0006ADAF0A|nr:DUF11 domain-containing protein [Streptomyces sp. WM6378]